MKEHYQTFQKIKEKIDNATYILALAHQNPDGDGLGALLALGIYFRSINIPHILFSLDPVPEYFQFLPNAELITSDETHLANKEFDLIIVLDSGDLEYAGVDEHFRKLKGLPVVINIDHHYSNTNFGHINLVHPTASSTSEIIYHFLDYFRHPINKEIATCLLTGILTDTGSFSNLATTPTSLEVASRLLASGARVRQITENTLKNKSLQQLQLWGRALSRIKKDEKTGVVTTVITQKDFDELGIDDNGTEGIANFLNNIDDAKAIIVLREKEGGVIKASLRTTHPDIDVSDLAKKLGGGGHKKAAGFSVKGRIIETNEGWKIV